MTKVAKRRAPRKSRVQVVVFRRRGAWEVLGHRCESPSEALRIAAKVAAGGEVAVHVARDYGHDCLYQTPDLDEATSAADLRAIAEWYRHFGWDVGEVIAPSQTEEAWLRKRHVSRLIAGGYRP